MSGAKRTVSDAELMKDIRSGLGLRTAAFVALGILVGRKVRVLVAVTIALASGICSTEPLPLMADASRSSRQLAQPQP
jgi:hypothetical protein